MDTTLVRWAIFIVLSAMETWIGYKLFNTYLTRNAVKQCYYNVGIVAYFIFQMLSYVYQSSMFSTAIYYFLFSAAIAILFFSDSLPNKITIALLFVIMNYACKTAVTAVMLVLGLQEIVTDGPTLRIVMNPLAQMLSCLLFVASLWGTVAIRRLRLNSQNTLYTILSFLFPVCIMAAIAIISLRDYGQNFTTTIKLFYFYAAITLFSSSIGLFYLLEKNIMLDISSEKSAVMEELLAMQRRHYERLETSHRDIRSLRHDIKNHMYCLHGLIETGHIREAREYIEDLYRGNPGFTGISYSGNVVIDSIVSSGFAPAYESGVNVKCSVLVPPVLNIEDVDLCILFGNLIDNAVEACGRMTDPAREKYIILNVNIRKDYLFVNIENSFNGEINKQNDVYKTVKSDTQYYGIGLFNIKKVVDKYNGELSIDYDEKAFNVAVMLSLDTENRPPKTGETA